MLMINSKASEERAIILPHVRRIEDVRKLLLLQKGKDTDLEKLKKQHYVWWQRISCEPKIDGIRAVFYDGQFITIRQKRIYNCELIAKELKKVVHPNEIVDGELFGTSWEFTQSVVMSSVSQKGLGTIKFHAFDCIPRFEFEQGQGKTGQEVRYQMLASLLGRKDFKRVKAVPRFCPTSFRKFLPIYNEHVEDGYEGMMIKHMDRPYLFYKGDAWMKCKHTTTEDVTVVGYKAGKGKYDGVLGSLVCEDERGNSVHVSGMDDNTRKVVWRQRRKHLGKVVEVKFYKITDGGNMYSAQFIRWRNDKNE